jgi:hypothetical protein
MRLEMPIESWKYLSLISLQRLAELQPVTEHALRVSQSVSLGIAP